MSINSHILVGRNRNPNVGASTEELGTVPKRVLMCVVLWVALGPDQKAAREQSQQSCGSSDLPPHPPGWPPWSGTQRVNVANNVDPRGSIGATPKPKQIPHIYSYMDPLKRIFALPWKIVLGGRKPNGAAQVSSSRRISPSDPLRPFCTCSCQPCGPGQAPSNLERWQKISPKASLTHATWKQCCCFVAFTHDC